jgi:hypothetical protein
MADTARDQILDAVRTITAGGSRTFSIVEVIAELRSRGTDLAESTIRTHVSSRMCMNAPRNHGTVYADFDRIGRGEYRWRA